MQLIYVNVCIIFWSDVLLLSGRIVAARALLKKATVPPKWQSPKTKGSTCNIPISERYNNCNLLSMFADTNGVIIVKLKRKVGHRGYVIFEPLGPTIIESF